MNLEERRLEDNEWLIKFREQLQKYNFSEVYAYGNFTGLNDGNYVEFYSKEGDIYDADEISGFLCFRDDGTRYQDEPKFMVVMKNSSVYDMKHLAYKDGVFYRVG